MTVAEDLLRWEPELERRCVDRRRVDDIAHTPMAIRLRNELITRAYGDISQRYDELFGRTDSTWAGFGQWASHTIGGFLTLPIPGLGRLIAQAFGSGNREVFADVGRAMVVFLETVGAAHRSGTDGDVAWQAFLDEIEGSAMQPASGPFAGAEPETPADRGAAAPSDFWLDTYDPRIPHPDEVRDSHRRALLVRGFAAYRRALTTSDPELCSRRILLGNCLLALHEQKVLSLAVSVGFRSWLRSITTFWRLYETRVRWRKRNPRRWRLRLEHRWIRIATRYFVKVEIPTGKVRCGRPVPAGSDPVVPLPLGDVPGADAALANLDAVDDDRLLAILWQRFAIDGRAAVCWNDLGDRMAYIMKLFAEHQRAPFWHDDYGKSVRPETWRPFQRQLAALARRIERTPRSAPAGPVPSPVSDGRLDELRNSPTHERVDDHHGLTLDLAAKPGRGPAGPGGRFGRTEVALTACHVEMTAPGGLLDRRTREQAHQVFASWRSLCFLGLLVRSLTDSYSAASGVAVLGRISDLATDPFRRAGETAQFVDDLLGDPHAWNDGIPEPTRAAWQSLIGVRKMHALVSNRLLDDGWDPRLGVPVNQEDVLGAALTFGVASIELFDSIDRSLLSDQERDAYTRFWLGVGHLMGVPVDVLQTSDAAGNRRWLDFREAQALAMAIRRRHRMRSLSGVRLAEALVDGIADGFPRPLYWVAPGLMTTLGEPEVASLLLIGSGRGRRRAELAARCFRLLLRARPLRAPVRALIEIMGRWWLFPFLEQGRSRPYRRPRAPNDDDRIAAARLDATRWPVNCSSDRPRLEEATAA